MEGFPKVPDWTLRQTRLEDTFGKPLDALDWMPREGIESRKARNRAGGEIERAKRGYFIDREKLCGQRRSTWAKGGSGAMPREFFCCPGTKRTVKARLLL
jgi:hypothetical protein